jgi:hypothetical protein
MKVLFLTQIWPEANASGASTRTLQLMDMFNGKGWQVYVWSDAELNVHSAALESMGCKSFRIGPNDPRFDSEIRDLLPDVVVFDRLSIEEKFSFRVWKECPGAALLSNRLAIY